MWKLNVSRKVEILKSVLFYNDTIQSKTIKKIQTKVFLRNIILKNY